MNKGLVLKLLALAAMALILVAALGRIEWKVQERRTTRDAAVAGISQQFAEAQQMAGPLLWLACQQSKSVTRLDDKQQPRIETETTDCSRAIRPAQLAGTGGLAVSERARGIYKARVYLASLRLNATFNPAELSLKPNQTLTGAYWVFGVSDPRGIKAISIKDGEGKMRTAQPGTVGSPLLKGFHVPVDIAALARKQTLTADIELAGSGRFDWVPVAENNDFSLRSAWPHPAFSGRYLPDAHEINDAGFNARWRVNAFAADGEHVLQQIAANTTATYETQELAPFEAATSTPRFSHGFGVSLIDPVDAYVQSDRAIRYGFLFVLLTLGGFYLFELLRQKNLHPLQYLLIGFAVVVFFLLLLALAEHLGFLWAYVIAAAACTALIAAYGRTLIGSWKASAVLGTCYGALFSGLYQLLASEDHALLMGAWLVFVVLAATMYLTRKLDWQGVGRAPQVAANHVAQPE